MPLKYDAIQIGVRVCFQSKTSSFGGDDDEVTAHETNSYHVSGNMYWPKVDTMYYPCFIEEETEAQRGESILEENLVFKSWKSNTLSKGAQNNFSTEGF